MTRPRLTKPARLVTAFYFLSSFAEAAQAVILLWLTFELTGSALVVGIMVALGYLPATLAGLVFQRFADRGRADRITHNTNLLLAAVSFAVAIELLIAGRSVLPTIATFMGSQVVLSLVKMINKAGIGRLLRDSFDSDTCQRVLQLSSSSSLIGRLLGAGAAGISIAQGWTVLGMMLTAVVYLGSVVAMRRGTADYQEQSPASPTPAHDTTGGKRLAINLRLATVLLMSVPSSGGLPFLSTMLVPLAAFLAPDRPDFYAILSAVSIFGGFGAGALLAAKIVKPRAALDFGLYATALLALGLAATGDVLTTAALVLVLTFTITAHIVCMQVLTNQAPQRHEVGQFAVLRNVVASLAKASYSFAAGALISAFDLRIAAIVLAVSCLPFAFAWPALRDRSRVEIGS